MSTIFPWKEYERIPFFAKSGLYKDKGLELEVEPYHIKRYRIAPQGVATYGLFLF